MTGKARGKEEEEGCCEGLYQMPWYKSSTAISTRQKFACFSSMSWIVNANWDSQLCFFLKPCWRGVKILCWSQNVASRG